MIKKQVKNKEFLKLVMDNIPSYVFWKNRDSIYQGCNQNFAESAGLASSDDIIGKSDYDLPWSKEESDYFVKIDKEVMGSGEVQLDFEEPITIQNGQTKWIRTSKVPLRNQSNDIIGILGIFEDITERKEMEFELKNHNNSLKNLNSKLKLINQDLEQFAYATSHDLQEPIRMIAGFSGLLKQKYSGLLGDEGNDYLEIISEGAKRMSSLVSQIMTYSRINNIEDEFEEASVVELVEQVAINLDLLLKERKAQLELDIGDIKIRCLPERMKMLFTNLITNGIKFNKNEEPNVRISTKEQEEDLYFEVADNGIGIDPKYLHLIFQPFKRLSNREEYDGNGIGLSICKRITRQHGGFISYKTNPNGGSIFYFSLPKKLVINDLDKGIEISLDKRAHLNEDI